MRWHQDEQGQILILFVVMSTLIFALAAFAIDQGYWYGRRREVQNTADASARAGAIAQLGRPTGSCVPSSPACALPCREAALTAIENWLDVSNQCDDGPTETDFNDLGASGGPSGSRCVEAVIDDIGASMFSSLFGVISIDIGARAIACAGTVRAIETFAGNEGPDGVAVVMGPTGNRDCFSGNSLRVGFECVVWGAMDESGQQHNRLLWTDEEDCAGVINGSAAQISSGVAWKCDQEDDDEVETTEINDVADGGMNQDDVLFAFRTRLNNTTTCDFVEFGAGPPQSFRNAFARGDGLANAPSVPPPAFLGGGSSRTSIYVQNDCFDNPRIVVMPITFDNGASGGDKDVDGFAIVYLTGCYDRGASIAEPNPAAETNTCSGATLPSPTSEDDNRECDDAPGYTPSAFCRVEIRGVPLRVFITRGAIGDLGAITNPNFPLTIQTVE
jgi:hypothetical protein